MENYLVLYLFFKLDEIKEVLFIDPTSIVFIAFFVLVIGAVITGLILSEFYDADESIKKFFEKGKHKKIIKWVVLFVCFVVSTNTISIILPSTGQMAAIYIGNAAIESDTADILAKLPKKYATLLDQKADEWLSEQVETVTKEEKK